MLPIRRVEQRQGPHALGLSQSHFRGDLTAHGVADEHRVLDAERIEQRDYEADVPRVRVAGVRFAGEAEAAVVERHHPVARGRQRSDRMSPRIHRRGESVDQHHRRAGSGVDVADAGAVYQEGPGVEAGAGRPPRFRGQGRRPASGEQQDGEESAFDHTDTWSARRARSTIMGWELHNAWMRSPVPVAVTA